MKGSKDRSIYIDRLLISISAFLLGLFLACYHASTILSNRISPEAEGKELILTGKIIGIPAVRGDGVRFLMDVSGAEFVGGSLLANGLKLADGSQLAAGSNKPFNLKGIVRLGWFQQAEELKSGETWHLKVKLKRPSGFMNPGGFDYEKWLFTQRIIATGYVRATKQGEEKVNVKMLQTITPKMLWSVDYVRQKIHEYIQENVENKTISSSVKCPISCC